MKDSIAAIWLYMENQWNCCVWFHWNYLCVNYFAKAKLKQIPAQIFLNLWITRKSLNQLALNPNTMKRLVLFYFFCLEFWHESKCFTKASVRFQRQILSFSDFLHLVTIFPLVKCPWYLFYFGRLRFTAY